MTTKFRRWLDIIIEGGWLLAVVLITLYFNIYTKDSRIFEPQKALALRTLVTFMLAAWAVRTLDEHRERLQEQRWWKPTVLVVALGSAAAAIAFFLWELLTWQDPLAGMANAALVSQGTLVFWALSGALGTLLIFFALGLAVVGAGYALRSSWQQALRAALVIPALVYVAMHVVSTIGSVFPQASLYGGYVRQQGTLTAMAYIGLFFLLAFNLRRREQLNRLITVILLTSIPSALYGVVQKAGIDPLPWMGNVEARVASTMGNAIFIAAYLIMILPLTCFRLLNAWHEARQSPSPAQTPPTHSPIQGRVYPGLLWGGIGLVLAGALIFTPISIMVQGWAGRQQAGAPPVNVAALWANYGQDLLLLAIAALLTVAVPALIYTVITLVNARWRPWAYLGALATAAVGAAVLLMVPATQTNGLAWAGYIGGLCGLALLSRMLHHRHPWGSDALWTDAIYILVVAQSLFLFAVIQQYLPTSPYPTKWWVYLAALCIFLATCYIPLAARIVGRVGRLAQVGGYLVLAGLQLACIILTQSRGPLAGLLAMVFIFPLLWTWRRGMRRAFYGVIAFFVAVGIFLAIFNLPHTPVLGDIVMRSPQGAALVEKIQPLRNIPYLGRLGRMFDAETGTGRVRILIWFGDEIGTGSVGMVTHHPLRTLIGYGPETMHVAYNPYYPPELAQVEKRNASPDRAHNAIIDELVTLGALGLAAYLFYFAGFFFLAWKLLRRAPDIKNQGLAVALFSLGLAHFVETLFGIPIVSTRMYMWIAIGMAVGLTSLPPFRHEALAAEAEEPLPAAGLAQRRRRAKRVRAAGIPTLWRGAFALVFIGAFLFTYRVNIKPVVADFYFWQAKQLEAQASAYRSQAAQIEAADPNTAAAAYTTADKFSEDSLTSLHQAIYLQPHEDFFFLSLAQTYLDRVSQADALRRHDLFRSTELAIARARALSPLNTDHYRNLSALFLSWFEQNQQTKYLVRAIAYGEQAISLTPNNADLHNRLARAYLRTASTAAPTQQTVLPIALAWLDRWEDVHLTSGGRTGDTHLPIVAQYRQQAHDLLVDGQVQRGLIILAAAELQYSLFLDTKYADTYLFLGDLYRQLNMPAEAVVTYATGLRVKPELLTDAATSALIQFAAETQHLWPFAQAYRDIIAEAIVTLERTDIVRTEAYENLLRRRISDAYQRLGYVEFLLGNNAAALAAYEGAQAIRPTHETYKYLGILYEWAGDPVQAREFAQLALDIARERGDANEINALQNLLELINQGSYLQDNPTDYAAHHALAERYWSLGRPEAALTHARLAAQYVPNDNQAVAVLLRLVDYAFAMGADPTVAESYPHITAYAAHDALAERYWSLDRPEAALTHARLAAQYVPADNAAEVNRVYVRLGDYAFEMGDYATTDGAYRHVTAYAAHHALAERYWALGQTAEALTHARLAAQYVPNDEQAVAVLLRLADYAFAMGADPTVAESYPHITAYAAHYALAERYWEHGRPEAALAYARLAAEYVPADNMAEAHKVYVRLGDYALAVADYATAEQSYQYVLQEAPLNFDALYGVAQAYAGQGRPSIALVYARRALQEAPEDMAAEVQDLVDWLQGNR